MGVRERASTNGNAIKATRPTTPAIGAAGCPLGRLDQCEHNSRETGGGEQRAGPVEPAPVFGGAFRHPPYGERDHGDRDWHVDKENPPPGGMFHHPSAEHGTDCSGNRCEARPGADGAPSLFGRERYADQREAARHEQCAASALEPRATTSCGISAGKTTPHGCGGKEDNADRENPAAAVEVAKRSSSEKKGCQDERIGFNDPLDVRYGRMQAGLYRGEGHVDHRAIDEGHARAEDCSGEDPWARSRGKPSAGSRQNRGFIARRFGNGGHYFPG